MTSNSAEIRKIIDELLPPHPEVRLAAKSYHSILGERSVVEYPWVARENLAEVEYAAWAARLGSGRAVIKNGQLFEIVSYSKGAVTLPVSMAMYEGRDAEGNVYTYESPAIIPDLEQLEIMPPDVGNVILRAAVQMLIRVAHDQARKIEELEARLEAHEAQARGA